jgi:hypothetical protein
LFTVSTPLFRNWDEWALMSADDEFGGLVRDDRRL